MPGSALHTHTQTCMQCILRRTAQQGGVGWERVCGMMCIAGLGAHTHIQLQCCRLHWLGLGWWGAGLEGWPGPGQCTISVSLPVTGIVRKTYRAAHRRAACSVDGCLGGMSQPQSKRVDRVDRIVDRAVHTRLSVRHFFVCGRCPRRLPSCELEQGMLLLDRTHTMVSHYVVSASLCFATLSLALAIPACSVQLPRDFPLHSLCILSSCTPCPS
jgi:hypothetical protein